MPNNPYTPSSASLTAVPRTGAEGFRDLSAISGSLSILLALGVAAKVYEISVAVMLLQGAGGETLYSDPGAVGGLQVLAAAAMNLADLLLKIGTVIVFARWIYLAHKNLRELGARYLRCSPAWAVWSFFIPLIQWWVPFQAMRDLAKASRNPGRWDLEDTPGVIVAWWPLWLIAQFVANISLLLALSPNADPEVVATMSLLESVLAVPLYLLARLIVRRTWRDQLQVAQAAAIAPPA